MQAVVVCGKIKSAAAVNIQLPDIQVCGFRNENCTKFDTQKIRSNSLPFHFQTAQNDFKVILWKSVIHQLSI